MLLAFAVGALILVLLIAGCGGGDDSGSTSTSDAAAAGSPAPRPSALAKQVNAYCERARKRMLAAFVLYAPKGQSARRSHSAAVEPEPGYGKAIEAVVLPAIEEQAESIEKLANSSEGGEQLDAFLAAQQKAIDVGNKQGIYSQRALGETFKQAGNEARSAGIDACAFG